jgi:hypothetical protein
MPDADELDARLAQARRRLSDHPHVVGVGFGYKERGGELTQELSLRVYVRQKRPASELSADDLVPPELFGIQTDVLTVPSVEDFSCEIIDSFSPLVGGIGITNLKGASGIDLGTLGCFATLDQMTGRDNIAVLTNQHVLAADGGQVGDTLYQPKLTTDGTNYTLVDKHPIGSIVNLGSKGDRPFTYPEDSPGAANYYVDCATAKVDTCYSSWCHTNCGVGWTNEILGLAIGGSSALDGIARIRNSDLPAGGNYVVTKVGSATGRTVGKVTDAAATAHHDPTNTDIHNLVLVDHLGPSCGGGTKFADHGDSGAVVVNDQRKVIALVFGGSSESGTVGTCHIHPVIDALGITVISTAHNPDAAASHALLEAPRSDSDTIARAAQLREEILRDERVRMLYGLVQRHREEVAYLVNRVRRVTLAWHRVHGPDFLAHALHASRHAGYPVPRELDGVERAAAIDRMLEALEQHGSAPLRHDLELHADMVRALVGGADDLEGLAARLRAAEPTGAGRGSQ